VDDARNAALELRLERDHVAPVALGDQRLLQVGRVVGVVHDVAQLGLQPVEGDPHFAADARQLGAGRIQHFAGVVQHAPDLVLEGGAFFQPVGDVRQPGKLVVQPAQQAV